MASLATIAAIANKDVIIQKIRMDRKKQINNDHAALATELLVGSWSLGFV
jgi:hypothetical protein